MVSKNDRLSARAELVNGVANILAEWDRPGALYYEGAGKIVSWVLSHKCLHEAVTESILHPIGDDR